MKKRIFTLVMVFASIIMMAQTPNMFNYQAIARNASGETLNNQDISVEISILDGTSAVFTETHNVTTNQFGLFTLKIGDGTSSLGSIANIDFSTGAYSLQVSVDETGGSNYSLVGTSQLISVPYALHAKTAESITGTINEADPIFTAWDKDYSDLTNTPDLSGYLTSETDPTFTAWDKDYSDLTNTPNFEDSINTYGFDGNYAHLTGTPAIPSNVSDLNNDLGFISNPDDADASPTNEIQDLTLTGNTLSLTSDATTVDLSKYENLKKMSISVTGLRFDGNCTYGVGFSYMSGIRFPEAAGVGSIYGSFIIPDNYTAGDDIFIRMILSASATGNMKFSPNSMCIARGNGSFIQGIGASTGLDMVTTVPSFPIINKPINVIAKIHDTDLPENLQPGDAIIFSLFRYSADASDTNTGTVTLHGLEIYY
ncbi:MAG: hypothetical protein CVU05_11780 [Bacteroidetes bacterium HGW-Bacteroidetes-21]|jgi:hypothetical protein|nr:MAG: hypothetical protein CVU05_11780 [Bacteroidetes bacterium HGW-Bacteroidetes-21]